MSARRSWDIRPKGPEPKPVKAPQTPVPVRRVRKEPVIEVRESPRAKRVARDHRPLKERRKEARKRLLIAAGVLVVVALAALVYLLWQPFVRIQAVTAEGPHAEEAKTLAELSLEGTYAFVLPKDSIFIYPEGSIRSRVKFAHPDIASVTVTRESFTSIHMKLIPRAAAFNWCGASYEAKGECYEVDAEGFVFARAASAAPAAVEMLKTEEAATTTAPVGTPVPAPYDRTLSVYASIDKDATDPIRAHVNAAARIPAALALVKTIRELGIPVASLVIREDEADIYTVSGTRITYVLGKEQEAAGLAISTFPTLNFEDGLLEYVDLRFGDKVYLKRFGDTRS